MKRFLVLLFVGTLFFSAGFVTGIIVSFYNPSVGGKLVKTKNLFPQIPETEQNQTEETQLDLESIKPIVERYFVSLREGITEKQALVFKANTLESGTELHLLTLTPSEWDFVKVFFEGVFVGTPETVYKCPLGVYDIVLTARGFLPPQAERAESNGSEMFIALPEEEKITVIPFDNCTVEGFVFNAVGKLAGICTDNKFLTVDEFEKQVFSKCVEIVYEQETSSPNMENTGG